MTNNLTIELEIEVNFFTKERRANKTKQKKKTKKPKTLQQVAFPLKPEICQLYPCYHHVYPSIRQDTKKKKYKRIRTEETIQRC